MSYFVVLLFGSIPLIAVVFFIASLIQYLSAKKQNEQASGTYSEEDMKAKKKTLTVSAVVAGILVAVVIAFVYLMYMVVAYM